MKLSVISIALIPMLSLSAVQAAVYDVVEVGDVAEVSFNSAAAINDAGEIIFNGAVSSGMTAGGGNFKGYSSGNGKSYFNYPLRLDAIDFTSESVKLKLTDEQIADAQNGNIDADTLSLLIQLNFANQPIGLGMPYLKKYNTEPENIILRDFLNEPARGNSEYLYDINNQSVAVGVASTPFLLDSFTAEPTEDNPEPSADKVWMPQGPVVSGVVLNGGIVTTIPAPYQGFGGGFTVVNAISNTGYIAGIGSTGMKESIQAAVNEECDGKTKPVAVCLHNTVAINTGFFPVLNPNVNKDSITAIGRYDRSGMIWQLTGDTLSEPEILPFLGDKNTGTRYEGVEPIDIINYHSRPFDVNDAGIAVGWSVYSDSSRETVFGYDSSGQPLKSIERSYQAAIFKDGQALPLVDPSEWERSSAVAINNNNIVVGGALKLINSNPRIKMFVHDISADKTDFVTGFFISSTTIPRAINDNNIIVGQAEAMLGNTTVRRNRAFIMDLANGTFEDLNTLIGCNATFTLVDATSINNQGEILATAIVKKNLRDAKGNVILDDSGTPFTENSTTTVMLNPIANGEAEQCNVEDETYQRQGGSFSFAWLLGLAVIGWRRLQS